MWVLLNILYPGQGSLKSACVELEMIKGVHAAEIPQFGAHVHADARSGTHSIVDKVGMTWYVQ